MSPTVAEAYEVCRRIARSQAKNFYYAFIALPSARRDAICAVYAFMRQADDFSDDETLTRAMRRQQLAQWLAAWRGAEQGGETANPVFIALRDAQHRFGISSALLDQLVEGTAMDLDPARDERRQCQGGTLDTYPTFDELYRYCYLVASVVGLVTIRIFGYTDVRAEKLAEETGIAFQLTNILRDVREDAERGRIYLPLADLERFGVSAGELASLKDGRQMRHNVRELLEFEAGRAEAFYRSGYELLPLIHRESQPALWVLIAIYHRLLRQMQTRGCDVFTTRVRVSTTRKLIILARGLWQVLVHRMRPS